MEKVDAKQQALKIVVTGPESTGKSVLSNWLAAQFGAHWVPEYSRSYLENLTRGYQQADLDKIAVGQIRSENDVLNKPGIVICDTSLEVLKIWSMYKYKSCSPFIFEQNNNRNADLFLLLAPDIPWLADPLRENPDDREELFNLYKQELGIKASIVIEIHGNYKLRQKTARDAINELIASG